MHCTSLNYIFFCLQSSQDDDLFQMAKYMVSCCNAFFRVCRRSGIFIGGSDRSEAIAMGMDMNESCISPKGYPNITKQIDE